MNGDRGKLQPSGLAVDRWRVIYEFWSNLEYSLSFRIHLLVSNFFLFFFYFPEISLSMFYL